jgi:hypothetical protein
VFVTVSHFKPSLIFEVRLGALGVPPRGL